MKPLPAVEHKHDHAPRRRATLLCAGLGERLGWAGGCLLVLWLVVGWALR